MENREQRMLEPATVDSYEETVSKHSRAAAHMKSQCLLKGAQEPCKLRSDSLPARSGVAGMKSSPRGRVTDK